MLWLLLKFNENVKQTHAWTEIRLGTLEKVKTKTKHIKKKQKKLLEENVLVLG